jgi:hypothetical protein
VRSGNDPIGPTSLKPYAAGSSFALNARWSSVPYRACLPCIQATTTAAMSKATQRMPSATMRIRVQRHAHRKDVRHETSSCFICTPIPSESKMRSTMKNHESDNGQLLSASAGLLRGLTLLCLLGELVETVDGVLEQRRKHDDAVRDHHGSRDGLPSAYLHEYSGPGQCRRRARTGSR